MVWRHKGTAVQCHLWFVVCMCVYFLLPRSLMLATELRVNFSNKIIYEVEDSFEMNGNGNIHARNGISLVCHLCVHRTIFERWIEITDARKVRKKDRGRERERAGREREREKLTDSGNPLNIDKWSIRILHRLDTVSTFQIFTPMKNIQHYYHFHWDEFSIFFFSRVEWNE